VRLGRLLLLIGAVVVVSAAVASGVTYALVGRGSVAHAKALAPVAYVGVLRDTAGKPVAHAWIQVNAFDDSDMRVGEARRAHQLAAVWTDAAGRFTIRVPQSVPLLRKMAAPNDGWVNMRADIYLRKGHPPWPWMPWGAPRQMRHHAWVTADGTPAAAHVERITFKSYTP